MENVDVAPSAFCYVNHRDKLSDRIAALYMKSECSDVDIIIEGNRIPGHKVILGSCSEYFRNLLFDKFRKPPIDEVEMKDVSFNSFKIILEYVYGGFLDLSLFREELILEIVGLACRYGLVDLEAAISDFLKQTLCISNVLMLYEKSKIFNLPSLAQECSKFVDQHADDILRHKSFLRLSVFTLTDIISRDSFYVTESKIFLALCEWAKVNTALSTLPGIWSSVRLPLMSSEELTRLVRPTERFSPDTILDAFQQKSAALCRDDIYLNHRGYLQTEVALPASKAIIVVGNETSYFTIYDSNDKSFSRNNSAGSVLITGSRELLISLDRPYLINHIHLFIGPGHMENASYFIKVSADEKDWVKVIDYTFALCRNIQSLYFDCKATKFIKIGGNLSIPLHTLVHDFKCMYKTQPLPQNDGFVYPIYNVSAQSATCVLIEGFGEGTEFLVRGDVTAGGFETLYTWHKIRNGAIVVQLGQPYIIESIRMLLWDFDGRSCGYYIEVSTDKLYWQIVTDKRQDFCGSWQVITFHPRPVVFIRIVGTHCTVGEDFRLCYLECPAQI